MKDKQLIQKIQNDDIHAFEELFRKYYELLCQWAYHYLHDRDSAEEVVQDLYYKLWKDRAITRIRSSVKSYLYTSVSNNCMMTLKKQARRSAIEAEIIHENNSQQPSEILEINEIEEVINRTLEELPERPAEIFRMSRYDGMKYREIAEKLSISVKTVEANMGKALESFRKNLQEYLE